MKHYFRFSGGLTLGGHSINSFTAYEVYNSKPSDSELSVIASDLALSNAKDSLYLIGSKYILTEEIKDTFYSNSYCSFEEITQEEYKKGVSGNAI